jgi:ribosomal protein S18 acetylase RimI-like enzyme
MKVLHVLFLFLAGVCHPLPVCAQSQESPLTWFARMDRNQDGKLSYEEVPSPRFAELDTDRDGFVTLAEFIAHLNREALKLLDRNGDGVISWDEFLGLYVDAERYFADRQRDAQPADGQTLPDPLPVKEDPLGLRFQVDYVPGSEDPQGRVLSATETTALVAHRGQLFATFGGARKSADSDPDFRGYAVVRKESADSPWQVDLDLGPYPFRTETMTSVAFHTDYQGRKLPEPVPILVAGNWSTIQRKVLVRDDGAGKWLDLPISREGLLAGETFSIRSFGSHVDRVTGVHLLFAGGWRSSARSVGNFNAAVYRAAYDPRSPGNLRWSPTVELQGVGRIMAFAECNGDLYLAAAIKDDSPLSGGVFRRVDGENPRWELVYRWKDYDLTVWDDEQRMMRGLTAVPDPSGSGRQVLIGVRYFPVPVIERIDPQRDHQVTVEVNLKEYFGRAFHGGGKYIGPIRAAYNGFTAVNDPHTGETVHLAGVQIYHPGFPESPYNGSHYLVRRLDGTYDWGPVFDPRQPLASGRSLDATRIITISPFPQDQGRVLYFGGYDGPFVDNRTGWIYRAVLPGSDKKQP